ncbi:MAG: radical SAM protein, partial [Syntrophobacterales bacterium]|nr:radical SAM protein [Syntrophobacterales bacterium]
MMMNTPAEAACDFFLEDGFYPLLRSFDHIDLKKKLCEKNGEDVRQALAKPFLQSEDYLALLSPAAEPYLELMARRARDETIRHFGFTIQLFTPLYLANYCTNHCVYCGFNATLPIGRRMLTFEEVEAEARTITASGLRRLLVLTGDAPHKTGVEYIIRCLDILAVHFPSIGIEIPAMTAEEYARIVTAGAESITIFQETYHEALYAQLHPAGPKRNFPFRLDAPQRAVMGGIRAVNIGALLGL